MIADLRLLGFLHLRHLTPRPTDYAHPYPDFAQVVYAARATKRVPGRRAPDEYEVESAFKAVDEVRGLDLSAGEKLFLEAGLRGRS